MNQQRMAEVLALHYWDRFDGCACGVYAGDTVAWAQHVSDALYPLAASAAAAAYDQALNDALEVLEGDGYIAVLKLLTDDAPTSKG